MPTNSNPIPVSSDSRVVRWTRLMPKTITMALRCRAERQIEPPDGGERDTGEDAVRHRVAEERQTAHDDPGADQRRHRGRDEAPDQGPPGDLGCERIGEQVDHRGSFTWRATR